MPKLPTTTSTTTLPIPAALLCAVRDIFIFLCNWQSDREQQRKSICLQSLNVIALHVCTLSPTLLGCSTRRSLLSPHCSLRIWFSGSWSLDGISFSSSWKKDFKGVLFTQELRPWILVRDPGCTNNRDQKSWWKGKVSWCTVDKKEITKICCLYQFHLCGTCWRIRIILKTNT